MPAFFWLWFWLREDKQNPEPLPIILLAFVAGMAVVPLALPLQKLVLDTYSHTNLLFLWVIIEETLKYILALGLIFWRHEVDEPVDMVIYMIAVALGFACLENALYMFNPFLLGDYFDVALNGALRFVGATLLHVLSSATVGIFLAFTFYKRAGTKLLASMLGLCLAITLHTIFNFFIMNSNGGSVLSVFLFVWVGVVILFFLFEKIKQLDLYSSHYLN